MPLSLAEGKRLAGVGLLLAPAAQAQTANALSGAYTINSAQPTAGTNFISFSDAATRLNTDGVSGLVTITVSGGPYTEQFLLGEVAGTSATNTLAVNGGGAPFSLPRPIPRSGAWCC